MALFNKSFLAVDLVVTGQKLGLYTKSKSNLIYKSNHFSTVLKKFKIKNHIKITINKSHITNANN